MERVPRVPSVGQAAAVEVVGVLPETVVVVNWQGCQLTAVLVVVPPVTVAVRVVDWPRIIDGAGPREEVTVTTTVFAPLPLLPQPAASKIDPTAAAVATIAFDARKVKPSPCPPPGVIEGRRWHLG